jgi:hypothetical protein
MSFDMKYDKNFMPIRVPLKEFVEEKNTIEIPQQLVTTEPISQEPTIQEQEPIIQSQDIALEPVVTAQAQATQEIVEPEAEPVSTKPKKSAESWRDLRKETLRLAKERDEALREISELKAARAPVQEVKESYPVEENPINDGDLAEGRHLKELKKEINELKKELKQFHKYSNETNAEQRILQKYPDFYKVVSKDNALLLKELEPEMASVISKEPDIYSQSIAAYKAIKQFGIYREENVYEPEKTRALQNAAKPRPLASLSPQQGDSPLSHANAFADGLTPELKKHLLKEMNEAIRNR